MDPRLLRIADHSYELPEEKIAVHPLAERDAARLLHWAAGGINDRVFSELPELLPTGTVLVVNDTRVVHARIALRKPSGGLVECMVMRPADGRWIPDALQDIGSSTWLCMVGNGKRWRSGPVHSVAADSTLSAEKGAMQDGLTVVRFSWSGDLPFHTVLEHDGQVPLPPYMRRVADANDPERYNTVFAQAAGSVAAPTASLHFTPRLLQALAEAGVDSSTVTLHVGAGTFLPVKAECMADHGMHQEEVAVPRATIVQWLKAQGAIVPVGTTALRTLESVYWHGAALLNGTAGAELNVQQWQPYEGPAEKPTAQAALTAVLEAMDAAGSDVLLGRTRLLIAPGYRFRLADGLITNFHQPGSTLLLLVAAFLGEDWRKMYAHALANDYRFLSYGDGSLLWKPRA